jgi:triacylglycerol esterase/lipase EstA (alpha/beta hydrolase family)
MQHGHSFGGRKTRTFFATIGDNQDVSQQILWAMFEAHRNNKILTACKVHTALVVAVVTVAGAVVPSVA